MQVHLSEWESVDEAREKVATEGSVVEPSTAYVVDDEETLAGVTQSAQND